MKGTTIGIIILVLLGVIILVRSKGNSTEVVTETPSETNEEVVMDPEAVINPDLENSKIIWTGDNIVLGKTHTGTLSFSSIDLSTEGGVVSGGEFIIAMNSLEGDEPEQLITHLKSQDFFDVIQYPEARFVIRGVTAPGMVTGDLTIKNKTQSIQFPYSYDGTAFKGEFDFDRTLFDVNFNSGKLFPDVGDNIISDTVHVSFEIPVQTI